MAVKSGFFNSDGGDRTYDATDINSFFEGFVQEGVLSPVGDWLYVTPGGGLSVNVGSGKAWFMETFLTNTQPVQLTLAPADLNFPRIDVIALDFDMDARVNSIVAITGTPASGPSVPTLANTATHKQYELARVAVVANETVIETGDIENRIGLSGTPFATGLLQQATTDELISQWRAEFNAWMADIEADLQEIDTSGVLADIADIRDRVVPGRNILINGCMRINQRGETSIDIDSTLSAADRYPLIDRWRVVVDDVSEWTASWSWLGNSKYGFRMTNKVASTLSNSAAAVYMEQKIEGGRLGDALKGTSLAKPLTLGFKAKVKRGGNYVVQLVDEANNRHISESFFMPGDTVYHKYEWTIPADFAAEIPLDNSGALSVIFWLAAGSDYTSGNLADSWEDLNASTAKNRAVGQLNVSGTTYDYVELTEVQLEVGSTATDFDWVPTDEVLRQCRRYREFYDYWHGLGISNSAGAGTIIVHSGTYQTKKRVSPSMSGGVVIYGYMSQFTFSSITSGPDPIEPNYDGALVRTAFTVTHTNPNILVGEPAEVTVQDFMIDAEIDPT